MTDPVLPENELRQRVQQRIEDGRLPVVRPRHIDAGYGSGKECHGCGLSIEAGKVEYEITQPEGGRLRFHFTCYILWQSECSQRIGRAQQPASRDRLPQDQPPDSDTPVELSAVPRWRGG